MKIESIPNGTVHKLPNDLREALLADEKVVELWRDITPLARNEWICWVENAKLVETRKRRIVRVPNELRDGMRRPCCWIGCTHRTDKEVSPSVRSILRRKNTTKSA